MSSSKITIEETIARLKLKKNQIMTEENQAKENIHQFYNQAANILAASQKQCMHKFNQSILQFYERISSSVKSISARGKNADISVQMASIDHLMQSKLQYGSKISHQKLQELLSGIYQFNITDKTNKFVKQQSISVPEMTDSQYSLQTGHATDLIIDKIQSQRDYYQKRQQQLIIKIKQLQNCINRKGINIKDMTKSSLQEKCSKWAVERIKEENKILVEKIGEASQEIIKLNSENSEQQMQIKKLINVVNQINGKSMIGSSGIKSSLMMDSQFVKRERVSMMEETNRDREIELQLKNQQLIVQITKIMKKQEEQSQFIKELENKVGLSDAKIIQLQEEINQLKHLNGIVNHDYEISLRRKAAFEQECNQLKAQLKRSNERVNQQKEQYKNIINNLEQKQKEVIIRVKELEETKAEEIFKLEQRLKAIQEERERLLKKIEEVSFKRGEEINYKQLLNDQITRLLKENAVISMQVQQKEQKLFLIKQEKNKLQNQMKEFAVKAETNKKQCSRFKKQNKELQKQIIELQKQCNEQQNIQYRVAQFQQNYIILQSQFNKFKDSSQRKAAISQRVLAVLKERFNSQLMAILGDELKVKGKKNNSRVQVVDKYIEEMINLSSKSAQLKQLKEQNRQLKELKQRKNSVKKLKYNSNQENISNLENGLWNLGTKILEERLKSEKTLYQQQIKQLKETLAKEQLIKSNLQQQLQKQKSNTIESKNKQKQEQANEDSPKLIKQFEQKIQKIQTQLRSYRAMVRKLQTEVNEAQSQVKTKRELASGLKKQTKEKDDIMREIQIQKNIYQQELEKIKRNAKEISKKQTMFKEIKEKQIQVQEENQCLKKNIQSLQDRIKIMSKQLGKKQETLRQIRSIEEKEIKIKEEGRLKEANQTIAELKDMIRKIKAEVERKDEIIKNIRGKADSKTKQYQQIIGSKDKQMDRIRKELEVNERKMDTMKNNYKKQQSKNCMLVVVLKKIYQMCCTANQRDRHNIKQSKRESTQYFSGSSASSQVMKTSTPVNNFKTLANYQGLAILNLSAQDLMDYQPNTTLVPSYTKHTNQNMQNIEMTSPITNKNMEISMHEQFLHGLQELQHCLALKEMDINNVTAIFKKAIQI